MGHGCLDLLALLSLVERLTFQLGLEGPLIEFWLLLLLPLRIRYNHVMQLSLPQVTIGPSLLLLVGLRSLLIDVEVLLHLHVDLVDVSLGQGKLLLQSHLLLLQGKLGTLGVLVHKSFNLVVDARGIHGGDNILAIRGVELRREDVVHGFSRTRLVIIRLLLDELGEGHVPPSHCLLKCLHEVLIELLLCVIVQLVILLQQCALRPDLVEVVAGSVRRCDPLGLVTRSCGWSEGLDLLNDGLPWVYLVDHSEESS